MSQFDITKSGFTDEKRNKLQDDLKKNGFSKDVQSLSGIGPKTCKKLEGLGYENAYQLVAKFLSFWSKGNDHQAVCEEFYVWYKETTKEGGHGHAVTANLMWALHYGLKDLEVHVPEEMKEQKQYDQTKIDQFLEIDLDPDLSALPGVGPKGVKGLNESDITTSWQLCGLFLKTMDMEKFSETLKESGVDKAWAKLVAYLLALKCQKGLKREVAVSQLDKMFKKIQV